MHLQRITKIKLNAIPTSYFPVSESDLFQLGTQGSLTKTTLKLVWSLLSQQSTAKMLHHDPVQAPMLQNVTPLLKTHGFDHFLWDLIAQ